MMMMQSIGWRTRRLKQPKTIDVKKRFYSGHVFLRFLTFFILPTFFYFFLKTFIENTI